MSTSTDKRVLERDVVYQLVGPEKEPRLEDFASLVWTVSSYSIRDAGIRAAKYLSLDRGKVSPYPQWYALNGVVYSVRGIYNYLNAFYPRPEPEPVVDQSHWVKLVEEATGGSRPRIPWFGPDILQTPTFERVPDPTKTRK